jgi:serine protease
MLTKEAHAKRRWHILTNKITPMKKYFLLYSVLLILLNPFAQSVQAGNDPKKMETVKALSGDFEPNTVIIKLKSLTSQARLANGQSNSLNALLNSLGKKSMKQLYAHHGKKNAEKHPSETPEIDLSLIYELKFDANTHLDQILKKLREDPNILYAEPKYISKSLYTPNDPDIAAQYYLNLLKSFQAWDISKGDTNIVIGVTDEGFDLTHPDLVQSVKYNYKDPIDGLDNDGDGYIDNYYGWNVASNNNIVTVDGNLDHGVAVAGLAAATTDNATGMAGNGFRCKYLPIKIEAAGALKNEFMGIVYAADHGCQIVNCSWGHTGGPSQYEQDIITYATSKNCLVVAAAGNNNDEGTFYPASYQYVISVAATNSSDQKGVWNAASGPKGSNYGYLKNGKYVGYANGTSFACPIAAGCAAMIKSQFPSYNCLQVGERLRATCDFIDTVSGNAIFAGKLGRGRINLYSALTAVTPSIRMDPINFADGKGNNFLAGDTMAIFGKFTNFLDPAVNLNITLTSNSPYVSIINGGIPYGPLKTLAAFSNQSKPFLAIISPNTPLYTKVLFKLTYTDGKYVDYQYIEVVVNPDYLNITNSNISTTIASNGSFGFSRINQQAGNGFNFKGTNLLYAGGLVLNSGTKTVDAVYGATPNSMDTDFTLVSPVKRTLKTSFADQEVMARFNDSLAGVNKIGVLVTHKAFAWKSPADSNYVILEYTIKNTNTTKIDSLYTGFYADWDIDTSNQNRADYNNTLRLGYVYSTQSAPHFAAVKLLTPGQIFSYAIDNPGGPGMIGIYNGFSKTDKSKAVKNNRFKAGVGGSGNDVSQMISSGPVSLAGGDSVKVAFAIAGGTSIELINAAATAADIKYNKPVISPGGNLTICNGGTVRLTSSPSKSYQWNTGDTTRTITVTKNGKYTVSVPGSNNNILTSDTVVLNFSSPAIPIVSAPNGLSFCAGDSVKLTSSVATSYKWSNGASTQSIFVSIEGNYNVKTNDASGCQTVSGSSYVYSKPVPLAQILTNSPTTFCQGSNITLEATAGNSYLWSNGATSQGITVNSAGTYTVSVKAAKTINPIPSSVIKVSGPLAFCRKDSVLLTAPPSTLYNWSTGSMKQSIVVYSTGDYFVTIQDAKGCKASSTPVHVAVDTGLQKPVILQTKNTLSSSVPAPSYAWYLNSKPLSGATNADLQINTNGIYTLSLIDLNGCVSTSAPYNTLNTGIFVNKNALFKLHQNLPNPCSKQTLIEFELPQNIKAEISLYTLLGTKVFSICSGSFNEGLNSCFADVTGLPDGVYYYRLQAEGVSISRKLIVIN